MTVIFQYVDLHSFLIWVSIVFWFWYLFCRVDSSRL